jgi:minor extracellular serine protease Vpr
MLPQALARRKDGTSVYQVIIYTKDPQELVSNNIPINSTFPNFVTARLTASQIVEALKLDKVIYIKPTGIAYPMNDLSIGSVGADLLHTGFVNSTEYNGTNVIVCIIDTGIDWDHKDFRNSIDDTQSRILNIWDQTITPTGSENSPSETGCNYGVEYTQAHIEDELDGSPANFVREEDTNGHGTHVAGTAAGNGAAISTKKYPGIAMDADIIFIKAGNGSFPNSNIIDGLSYAKQKAAALGKPIVVNMSLGSDYGPHDGTDDLSVATDNFAGTGRIAVVAAGNSGNENIHSSRSTDTGLSTTILFSVPSYSSQLGANNDNFKFDLWSSGNGNVSAQVTSPNGHTVSQTAEGNITTNTADGTIYIYNYEDGTNNDRNIYVSIYDGDELVTPQAGTWQLQITNNSGSTTNHHGWLYDATIGDATVTLNGGDSEYNLGNTANSAIIVGSYVHRWKWSTSSGIGYSYGGTDLSDDISSFSSKGPTRTGGLKPDIAAPGQGVGSSLSASASESSARILPGDKHFINQGTSMASPIVCGAVALLLQQDPSLSSLAIKNLINNNASTDTYTGGTWNATWGYGKLDIFKSMAGAVNSSMSADRNIMAYDDWTGTSSTIVNGNEKVAVRFTPTTNGDVTGFFIHPSSTVNLTAPLNVEIWSDNGSGLPQAQIGSTASVSQDNILKYSWNFISMSVTNARVTTAVDYHVVLSLTNAGDYLYIRHDNGSATNRSSFYNGSDWSQTTTYDLRMRPIVAQYGVSLEAKLFLEGPYNTINDEMDIDLYNGPFIPTTAPYSEDPRASSGIPPNVVDWVLVQLRESATGPAVASKSAFLHKDGRIVADDGNAGQIALDAANGTYYIVIKHRNNVAVMSKNTVDLSSGSSTLYDFTSDSSQYYGTGGVKELESGVWGMWAGDINQDGEITTSDYTAWYNSARAGDSDYKTTDVDMDTQVTTSDYTIWYNNARAGASSAVP